MTKVKGYKIDFAANTITMNYKFAKAAATDITSSEYMLLKEVLTDYPSMRKIVKSGRVQRKTKLNKRLTYQNMEKHISAYPNAAELMKRFETVKAMSKVLASPYKYVCDWFAAQFPEYKKSPGFVAEKTVYIQPMDAPDTAIYKRKDCA